MTTTILDIINKFPERRKHIFAPPSDIEIREVESELSFNFPDDYLEVMRFSNGLYLQSEYYNMVLAHTRNLRRMNSDEWYVDALPGMFLIGDDGSSALYFYDTKDYFKKGRNALYMNSKDALYLEDSVFLGSTLTVVVQRLLVNDNLK